MLIQVFEKYSKGKKISSAKFRPIIYYQTSSNQAATTKQCNLVFNVPSLTKFLLIFKA